MAEEHFDFASSLGAVPFFGSVPFAPPGLDVAAMAPFGMPPWASAELLPLPSDSAAAAAHFDSALSSLVSSPVHAHGGDDAGAIGDLIGRLGSICSNAAAAGSANNSCYSTPLSSPPRGASPAVAFRHLEVGGGGGRLSRVASSKSFGGAAEPVETSPMAAAGGKAETPAAARKRKTSGKGKAGANASPKRSKLVAAGDGDENADDAEAAEDEKKPEPEPVKDYIHVRARRGQATDSHSLAERVRREKISERMKLLQSLVPGCNKITGKALMLDEIINYVQSLQRQVEFLSMKLSTMNPELDVDAQYLPADKDMTMHHQTAMLGYPCHPDATAAFSYAGGAMLHPAMDSSTSFHTGASGFDGGCWDTAAQDLQSIVHRHDHHHGGGFHAGQQQQQQEAEAATVMSHTKVEP